MNNPPGFEHGRFQIHFSRLNLGDVENIVEQGQQHLAGIEDDARVVLPLVVFERRHQQHLRHAEDAVHRGADFMAHGGQKAALGDVGGFG